MSELDNLTKRMNYRGGPIRQNRMKDGKVWTLKQAYKSSYQRATAILSDGREFNCLLNPDKLNLDADYKMLSILFEDVCLNTSRIGKTSEGIVPIGMKVGDIFTWKETETDWLVTLQHIDEIAYFRADCYKCNAIIEMGDREQEGYICGPNVNSIVWNKAKHEMWNDLNYDAIILVPKTEANLDYLSRFNIVKINGNNWEVQRKNSFLEGIIEVALKEASNNEMEQYQEKPVEPTPPEEEPYIKGKTLVSPYCKYTYSAERVAEGGTWTISDEKKARLLSTTPTTAQVGITAGKSGVVTLTYTIDDTSLTLDLQIQSI